MRFKTQSFTYTSLAGDSFTTTEGTTGVELCGLYELDSDSLEELLTGSGLMGEERKGEDGVLEGTGELVQLRPGRKTTNLANSPCACL